MSLARNLSEARKRKGLSRRALSLQAGLSQSLVGQIERGDVSDTSSANLGALSKVLDVTVDWLIFNEEPSDSADASDSAEAAA